MTVLVGRPENVCVTESDGDAELTVLKVASPVPDLL